MPFPDERTAVIDEDHHVARFAAIGFRCRPEPWNRRESSGGQECRKLVFAPPEGTRSCNVHLRESGGANARYALLFRDHLRADSPARRPGHRSPDDRGRRPSRT